MNPGYKLHAVLNGTQATGGALTTTRSQGCTAVAGGNGTTVTFTLDTPLPEADAIVVATLGRQGGAQNMVLDLTWTNDLTPVITYRTPLAGGAATTPVAAVTDLKVAFFRVDPNPNA